MLWSAYFDNTKLHISYKIINDNTGNVDIDFIHNGDTFNVRVMENWYYIQKKYANSGGKTEIIYYGNDVEKFKNILNKLSESVMKTTIINKFCEFISKIDTKEYFTENDLIDSKIINDIMKSSRLYENISQLLGENPVSVDDVANVELSNFYSNKVKSLINYYEMINIMNT